MHAKKRKGISAKKYREFSFTPKTVLLVAHLLFDGSINERGVGYNNRNIVLINRVETLMKEVYSYNPSRYENKKSGVKRIWYYNVSLGAYLKIKSEELIKRILQMPPSLQKNVLIAFFDDEGCMDFRISSGKRYVRGYQKDKKILFVIQKLLMKFNIHASIAEPNEIVIKGKKDLTMFAQKINFSSGVTINEHRKNSIWKKSLEKRAMLEMAIQSYK